MILVMTDEMTIYHITINMGTRYNKEKQNNTIVYTKLRSYITLYNTYFL